ncbi:hypothetical protein SH601_05470 [Gracilibacillus sp. S3-1-1]|uniref:Uncharacterized protein n=1 Tax=Gracilibacillus pellucidus TaxID=3095368 RepID=A0ACC6M397_9BACI|nr:hypothetical protein [Gracilibacillus sp. S3-1-1]MDX8045434.1 hypothetical protein [Gracilibacillus sp. S3-1-1]
MTLIFEGAHVLNNAIVCTSDSKVVKYKDFSGNGVNGKPISLPSRNNKIVKLTDRVLYRSGGIKEWGQWLLKELSGRVKETDNLDDCLRHAKKIHQQLINKKDPSWHKYLDDERGLVVSLVGFDKKGKASLGMFQKGQWTKYNHESKWSCTGVAPSDDVMPYVNRLNRIEEPGIHYMFAEFWQAHRDMANNNPKTISNDMNVHIIKNVNGAMNYINFHLEDVNDEEMALGFYQALINVEKQITEQIS